MTVRVGFFGAGLIATYHSKMLRRSGEDVAWAGVHDPDRGRAEQFAEATGATVCDNEDAVLDGCDAVYVCTWTSEHARLVAAATQRGLPVFCEKPLAIDLATAAAMTETVQQAGVPNQVGLVLRSSPAFNWARNLIDDPKSGRVMGVVFRDDQYLPVQGMYGSTWRGDPSLAGSGTLLEHSIHDVDMIEFLCGHMESVSARTAEFHGISGIEDMVATSFVLAGGGLGTLASVWHDVLERPSLRHVEIFCERLWCAIDGDWFGPVHWTRAGGETGSLEGDSLLSKVRSAGLADENPDGAFVRAVHDGTPAQPDFATALRAHTVVDGLYRSAAAQGAPVDVSPGLPRTPT